MRPLALFICFLLSFEFQAQTQLDRLLQKIISFDVDTIGYQRLDQLLKKENILLLDSREQKEYETSHLKGAKHIGYNQPDFSVLNEVPKTQKMVVYCSLGVRSEDVAKQLKKKGYANVYNLYGGIFDWKNHNLSVVHNKQETDSVHAFDKEWGKWLLKGIKVYD